MDSVTETRDKASGRFLVGHKAGGRPIGSRQKLGLTFIEAMESRFQGAWCRSYRRV